MKLLIVEDEPKTVEYLRQGFTENGFVVDSALDGEEGWHLARTGTYALVILDVALPRLDGWGVLSRLRAENNDVPVLFLTARDNVADRVNGLKLGADDYLVKPFSFSELLARVRSILRRSTSSRRPERLTVGDLELDMAAHRALRGGQRLELTPKEFLLLALLMRSPGEPVSRTAIAEQVWDMNFDCDSNVVDVAMRRLRAKVDDPFPAKLIHTIRGVGYVLETR